MSDAIIEAVPAQAPAQPEAIAAPQSVPSQASETAQKPSGENITLEQLRQRRTDAARQRKTPAAVQAPASAAQPTARTQPESAQTAHASATAEDPTTETAPESQDAGAEDPSHDAQAEEAEAPLHAGLPEEIEAAISDAIAEPDKQKLTRKLVKRIQQLVTQRNEREAELLELKNGQKAAPKEQPQAQPTNSNVDPRLAAFDSSLTGLENAIARLEDNPDGLTITGDDGALIELDAKEVANLRRQYTAKHTDLVAKRAVTEAQVTQEHQAKVQHNWSHTVTAYPWIAKKESPEFQLALTELQQLGPAAQAALRDDPAFPLVVARYVAGFKAEQSRGTTGVTAPMKKPRSAGNAPAPVVAVPAGSAPKVNPQSRAIAEAQEQFRKTGKINDLMKLRKLMATRTA